MLSYRGEHLHIKSGREVYVKLSASIFRSLNVPDYPCDPHADGSSFTQVSVTSADLLIIGYCSNLTNCFSAWKSVDGSW